MYIASFSGHQNGLIIGILSVQFRWPLLLHTTTTDAISDFLFSFFFYCSFVIYDDHEHFPSSINIYMEWRQYRHTCIKRLSIPFRYIHRSCFYLFFIVWPKIPLQCISKIPFSMELDASGKWSITDHLVDIFRVYFIKCHLKCYKNQKPKTRQK